MSLLVWFYLISILSLLLSSNVLFYCVLLVVNSLCSIMIIYSVAGFAWYSLLMYVVYVGGVYILLLFVSIHNPNSVFGINVSLHWYLLSSFICWEVISGCGVFSVGLDDLSFNFCSGSEGPLYMYLCFFLVLGFLLVSIISGSKESFIR